MQAAEERMRLDASDLLNRARVGRVLVQRPMRSHIVVIAGIGLQNPASPKAITWSTHSRGIDPISLSAKPCCQGEPWAVDPIPVTEQVARGFIPRECLRDGGRMSCDVDPDELPAGQPGEASEDIS